MGLLSWFSGPRVTAKDKAILDLKRQRDKVKQYQKRIAIVQAREHSLAKECLAQGNRQRALLFLRKERFQKQQLERTDEQLESLEQLVSSIEFAQVQRDVVFGLEQGARILKEINAEMSLEKVDKIMEDTAEGIAYQEEVEALLNERITRSDEEAVERELAEMEEAVGSRRQAEAPDMPAVPNTRPLVPQDKPQEGSEEQGEQEEKEEEEEEEEEGRKLVAV